MPITYVRVLSIHTMYVVVSNSRRRHCEEASKILCKKSLRDANTQDVAAIEDPEMRRRAIHVVSEIERTEQAAAALKNADYHHSEIS